MPDFSFLEGDESEPASPRRTYRKPKKRKTDQTVTMWTIAGGVLLAFVIMWAGCGLIGGIAIIQGQREMERQQRQMERELREIFRP